MATLNDLVAAEADCERLEAELAQCRATSAETFRIAISHQEEAKRLRDALKQFADAVEKHAFEIPPPCPQTPVLVMFAQQARFLARVLQQNAGTSK